MLKAPVEVFLEPGNVDVKAKDFCRKLVLYSELFSPTDALLPCSSSHRAIMGLRLAARNCMGLTRLFSCPAFDSWGAFDWDEPSEL